MNEAEITRALLSNQATAQYFRGIIARNELCTMSTKGTGYYIVNTDDSYGPGKHWTAVFIFEDNASEFFDSFAKLPVYYGGCFRDFLTLSGPQYKVSRKCVQGLKSTACGHFCIYYVYHRCIGYSFEQILSMFSKTDFLKNDIIARDFVNGL